MPMYENIYALGLLEMLNKTIKTPAQWGMDSSVWLVNKNTAQMELTRTRPDHQLLQTNLRFAFRCHATPSAHRQSCCIVAKHFVSLNFLLVYFCFLSFYFLLRFCLALVLSFARFLVLLPAVAMRKQFQFKLPALLTFLPCSGHTYQCQ